MSSREGLAALCIAAPLLLVGVAAEVVLATVLGAFFAVFGFAVLAWNLIEADRLDRTRD